MAAGVASRYTVAMPDWTADYAFDQLTRCRERIDAAKGTNEAKTRLLAIDTTLFDVLGWDHQDVEVEEYVREEGYADYVLRHGGVPICVVEAKRDGESFVLSGTAYSAEPVGFGLLSNESKASRKALVQAVGYAASLGATYVAITNGHQYIITLAFVPGIALEKRSVLVFENLDAMIDRFRVFHDALSPLGVRTNALSSKLVESRRAPAPTKVSSSIDGYPKPADRNVLANEIGWVLSTVWDKANENDADEEFLRRCYVTPEPTKGMLAQAKEIIEQRARLDNQLISSDVHPQSDAVGIIGAPRPERPIIVLGRVGHGKSTFLDYLRLIEAHDQLAGYIQIEIDFLDRPTASSEVEGHVLRSFDEQILDIYKIDISEAGFARAALNGELRRFRRTVRGSRHPEGSLEQQRVEDEFIEDYQRDKHQYFTAAVRHLRRSHHKSVAIFFDNLDQRDPSMQEQAFLQASAMARDWESLVFVCLRPGTFYRSAASGALDAIAPRTITIAPPRPDIVLMKRFEFAREVAAGDSARANSLQAVSFGKNISAELPTAAGFFECCRDSFAGSRALTGVFSAVANGDMRALLRFIRDFLTSQHLNTKKIIQNIQAGSYLLAPHEAIRALLYGDYWHYDPNRSVFPNVFDIDYADGAEHFIRVLALHLLERRPDTSLSHGFVPNKDIVEYLCQIGYGQGSAQAAIAWLLAKKCVEDRLGESRDSAHEDQIRITPLGRFVVSELVGTFVYADAVVVDTPITDGSVRAATKDETTIVARVERCRTFKKYLDDCSAALRDADATSFWADVSKALEADIDRVTERIGART